MAVFDEMAEIHGDNEWREWLSKVLDLKIEIASFVAHRRRKGRAAEVVGCLRGSFNFGLHIRFSDPGPDALVRFPKPGHTAFRDENVANEVQFVKYLSSASSIPLPRVIDWGLTAESPHGLGPFIIMDYVKGTQLSAFLKQPTQDDQEDEILAEYRQCSA